ncbi:DNA-processing protein DprA [Gordonia jinhuaensis]|uniref:DNA processing protein n=1 Tax=Gordonia jinhuaensis TaxID=1517702 RepID=A0A916T5F6_9ACTN|nr:DNA-processing protein DprA [Gordonia jinhuaensis]GGB30259.1 hypothetical protein GCM10011489_18010 [Gordonia jinhuaensis]
MSSTQHAYAYLSRVAEPPNPAVARLVAEVGAVEAAAAIRRRVAPPGHQEALDATETTYEIDLAVQDLATVEACGGRLVTPEDAEWPAWTLHALNTASTSARGGAPLALWVRGPARLDELTERSIALVGSRAASSYGSHVTSTLAGELGQSGWAVVSGGAYGIDACAHRAALAMGASTVAVLACGIDRDYPVAHARLLAQIAGTGAVISEYPPGISAAKHRFLTRNRLVAALSRAVVVVEAGRRSGAANTAAWARRIGVPLGAVPGPITSAVSVGCHQMISEGQACLVADSAAAQRLAAPDGLTLFDSVDTAATRASTDDGTPSSGTGAHDDPVLTCLPGRGGVSVSDVANSAGLPVADVRARLALLEVAGSVVRGPDGWRRARTGG